MGKSTIGKCKLCGRELPLTYEHVPPQSAYNTTSVKEYGLEDLIKTVNSNMFPWEIPDVKGKIKQKGSGDYYLCQECNNNTGSWYMSHYVDFVRLIAPELTQAGDAVKSLGYDVEGQLMPLFKAIMVMFCDINHNCFGDEALRDYLLNKESTDFDTEKYKVCLYLYKGEFFRRNGISVSTNIKTGELITMSEISSFPLGMVLYIDPPKNLKIVGADITEFSKIKYHEVSRLKIVLPILENNTFFSGDYRTKQEIMNCINENK